MTSQPSREDVEAAAYMAGVKDPRKMSNLLRAVDAYAYALARKAELPPVDLQPDGRKQYLCRACDERLPLGAFPEEKRLDPAKQYDCIRCGGRDRKPYHCPECGQWKPLGDFPDRKQENPRLRVLCSYCEPRKVTRQDAGYVRSH